MNEFVTVVEAAKILGVTPATVRHHIYAGRLPVERVSPRLLLLRRSDVEAFSPPKAGWPRGRLRTHQAKALSPAPTSETSWGIDSAPISH